MTTFDDVNKIWTSPADHHSDEIPMGSYLGEAILKSLEKSDPNRVLEHNHDSSESISVKDIYQRTITVCKNLTNCNLEKDDVIAFYSRRNSYISSIVFACYLSGNPWCAFDIVQDDFDYLLDYIQPTILIFDKEFESVVKSGVLRMKMRKPKFQLIFGDPSASNSVENVLLKPQNVKDYQPRDISSFGSADELVACICFTSGSTGTPKGVCITHSMFVAKLNTSIKKKSESVQNIFCPNGIRWIGPIILMFIPIFSEAKQTFSGRTPNAANISEAIHKWRITQIIASHSVVKGTLDHYTRNPGYDFSSIRCVVNAGEAPSDFTNNRFIKALPHVTIVNCYGATESTGAIALQHDLGYLNGGHLEGGLSLRVVDDNYENLGHETPGIILVKGETVFNRYYKCDDVTKNSFTDDGWYKTGDYGFMTKDNYLHVHCRLNYIPKINGIRIVPNILEDHLNEHEIVDIGLMIPAPGPAPGNDRAAIYIKLKEGVDKVKARSELSEYIKRFIDWEIVTKLEFVDYIKTNSTGKVDKEVLKRKLWS